MRVSGISWKKNWNKSINNFEKEDQFLIRAQLPALRKAKIAYNMGLSKCNRVKVKSTKSI